MSIQIVRDRLSAVFTDQTPRVVFLTGGWGEGKTYQWRAALKDASSNEAPPKYAYLSLFGVGSLSDARKRLAEEFVCGLQMPGANATLGEKISELSSKVKFFQVNKLVPLLPYLSKAESLLTELSFSAVRKAVICIDDLERKGSGLSVADIFGLASFLKEDRDCRVVLIANDKKFAEGDAQAAQTFEEKVVDEHVHFAPTVEEACDIALGASPQGPTLLLRERIVASGVANIRVIHRLNRLVTEMSRTVQGIDPKVVEVGVLAVTVFGLGHFIPDGRFPTIEFVLRRNDGGWLRYLTRTRPQGAEPTDEQRKEEKWDEFLTQLGGPSNDPFEAALADAVRQGYIGQNLRHLAEQLASRLGSRALADGYHQAWMDFWHSLNGTGKELLDSLLATTRAAAPVIGPGDLRPAYDVFVAAGRQADADDVLTAFIEGHKDTPEVFDRSRAAFPEHFTGAYGDRLMAAAEQYIVLPSLEEVLDRIDVSSYNPADADVVAKAAAGELESLVRAATGRKFRARVRALLALGSMSPNNPEAAAVSARFAATLASWAADDPLTAIRLRQYLPQQVLSEGLHPQDVGDDEAS